MDLTELANQILQAVLSIVQGRKTITKAFRISSDTPLDLKALGKGKGVRGLTIRNIGDYDLILMDVLEPILPGETFSHNVNSSLCNKSFELKFSDNYTGSEASPKKDAIIRYDVDVC